MTGEYSGSLHMGGKSYILEVHANNKATRTDIKEGFLGSHLVTSVYTKGDDTYVHGDYKLYKSYENLKNTIRYYYFRDSEILKNNEATFSEKGIEIVLHHLSRDGNLEHYRREHDSIPQEITYRCGASSATLRRDGNGKTVRRLPVAYERLNYDTDDNIRTTATYRSLNEIATFKNLDWLKEKEDKYFVVTQKEEFDTLVNILTQAWHKNYAIAVDTETTGLNFNRFGINHPGNDQLVGICITHQVGYGWYIPVGHNAIPNLDLEYVLTNLKPILEQASIVTHYGKFDWMVFNAYGIDLNIVDDTFIILYILSNIDSQNNLKLKNATETYLGFDQIELSDIFPSGKEGAIKFQDLPLELVWAYAPTDADTTLSLYNLLRGRIPKLSESLYHHEVYFMKVLGDMEYNGNKTDMVNMRIEADKCLQDLEVLRQQIYQFAGYTFNINSQPAMAKLLYTDLKCEVLTKTDSGIPSTGAKALKTLSNVMLDTPSTKHKDICSTYDEKNIIVSAKDLNAAKYPIIHLILKYKKLEKLHSTFFTGLDRDTRGGWIFSSYNQTRALTGRTISNFQQIPGSLKHLIVPWSDDYYMVNLDYKSIELFVMVGVAGEEAVIKQFSHPESDAHRIIGGQILKKPPEEITGGERKIMKIANFGIPFDMGPYSLAQFLFGLRVTKEQKEEASKLKADYLNAMPSVKRMFNEVRDKAQTQGSVTTKFGRMGVFKNLVRETDPALIARGRRQAGNLIIQGTAADILKIATNRLYSQIHRNNMDVHITGAIHDELILIVNKKHHPYEIIKMVKDNMELKIKGFPTIYTGIAVSHDWGEGHGREILEIPQYLTMEICKQVEEGNIPNWEGKDYRDEMLLVIRDYLLSRFKDYFIELGLDIKNPHASNLYEVTNNFKHMYLGPRAVAYYTDFKFKGEPKQPAAIKQALLDSLEKYGTPMTMEELEANIKAHTPKSETEKFEELAIDFDLDEWADEYLSLEDNAYEEDIETAENTYDTTVEEPVADSNAKAIAALTRILVTYNDAIIKLDGCDQPTLTNLTTYFTSVHKENGYLGIKYLYGKKLIDTPFRVDIVDRDTLNDILDKKGDLMVC